jgi:3-oxoacyl-[acyl-carrier protein] reductase
MSISMSTNSNKLAGKVAVVSGASKGIGASIAQYLGAEGAAVVVNYSSSKAGADKVVDAIHAAGGKAIAVQGNVSKQADIERVFAETKAAFGRLDVLVNNAGIYEFVPLGEITEEHFRRLYDVNVLGPLLMTQEALKYFGPEGGSVINISSVVSSYTPPGSAVYSGTKGAVDALTKVLSKELGARKIRVNSINPGLVETEGTQAIGYTEGEMRKQFESQTPLGRIGQPADIAKAAVFLATEDSAWLTGESVVVSGGIR